MQHFDSTCFHCAQTFFLWLKQRVATLARVDPKGRAARSGPGNFAEAAATSIKAE